MSDPAVTTTPAVPTVTVQPGVPIVATAPTASATPATNANEEPHWLAPRLERERQTTSAALLRELGLDNLADAKAAVAELKAKREAAKTDAEKAAEAAQRAQAAVTEATSLKAAVAEFANLQMAGLTDAQKQAVKAIAGDDAAQQLKAIAALQPTWAAQATSAVAVPAATTPAVSADTAPANNAPPAVTTSPTDHRANYESLRKTNPFAAAAYGVAHPSEVFGSGG